MTAKRMFGEYGLYCEGKLVALACDDQLFVKVTEAGRAWPGDAVELAPAYPSAKVGNRPRRLQFLKALTLQSASQPTGKRTVLVEVGEASNVCIPTFDAQGRLTTPGQEAKLNISGVVAEGKVEVTGDVVS